MLSEAPIGDPYLHKVIYRLEKSDELPLELRDEYRALALDDRRELRFLVVPPPVPNGDPTILDFRHLDSIQALDKEDIAATVEHWGDKKADEATPGAWVHYSYGHPIFRSESLEDGGLSIDIVKSPVHEPQTPERFEKFYEAVHSEQLTRKAAESTRVPPRVHHVVTVFEATDYTQVRPSDIDRLKATAHLR